MVEYGKVVLTLSNVILPPEKLFPNPTPSMVEGLSWDVEYDLRLTGCELIQTAGVLLKLPQTAVATGQVLFHRYFYSSSFIRRPMEIVAMACTTLAAKIEENARRIRDVLNVFHHIKQVRSRSMIRPMPIDQVYVDRKQEVIKAERRLLKELGFCVYVRHPHKMIVLYLRILEKVENKDLVQTAWNYMNDSLRTDIFLRFTPETIACACIDLAARARQVSLPKNPLWYLSFGAKPDEIRCISLAILQLYNHRPKPIDELERLVNAIREKRDADRKKSRFATENDSPSLTQPVVNAPVVSTSVVPPVENKVEVLSSVIVEPSATTNDVKGERAASRSSTVNNHRHHHHDRRRRRSTSHSRSSSRSRSRSVKKKKPSHRSRSRSRSSTPKRRKHQKERRHHSHSSNHHRKKDRKRRSVSSSSSDENRSSHKQKHPLSTKDTNNNSHHRSHHHQSSKSINGVSSSSQKKVNSK